MDLALKGLGKLYGETWIFKDLHYHLPQASSWGIKGRNGSGKSTLLKIVLGLTLPSAGSVEYIQTDKSTLKREEWGRRICFTAPYLHVFTEFTAKEFLMHSVGLRPLIDGFDSNAVLELAQLQQHRNKTLQQYSTGMLQRFKLALALCTQGDILIFDEPTSNLDENAKAWFFNSLKQCKGDRTLIIASNEDDDFQMTGEFIQL